MMSVRLDPALKRAIRDAWRDWDTGTTPSRAGDACDHFILLIERALEREARLKEAADAPR